MANLVYNIVVNQRAIMDLGVKMTPESYLILSVMQSKTAVSAFQKEAIKEGNYLYFWFSHKIISEAIPMIFWGATERAIKDRIIRATAEMEKGGFIVKYDKCKELSRSYYRFTPLSDMLLGGSVAENTPKNVGKIDATLRKNAVGKTANLTQNCVTPNADLRDPLTQNCVTPNADLRDKYSINSIESLVYNQKKDSSANAETAEIDLSLNDKKSEEKFSAAPPIAQTNKAKPKNINQRFIDAFFKFYLDKFKEDFSSNETHLFHLKNLRNKLIPQFEKKAPLIGRVANDDYFEESFNLLLAMAWDSSDEWTRRNVLSSPTMIYSKLSTLIANIKAKVESGNAENLKQKSIDNYNKQLQKHGLSDSPVGQGAGGVGRYGF